MHDPLPIDSHLGAIVWAVRAERAAVIVAPPGAGKTTRVAPALTELGRVMLLQPRRVAARALTRRIAEERGWTIGEEIGWQIRFERRFSSRTRLLVATEGVLTARLQRDPLLGDFEVVVLDEFHERSIHADLALALVREAAISRSDLAVVVMSATLDAAEVARFLDFAGRPERAARVIEVGARRHAVAVDYRPGISMAEAVVAALPVADGHILCFLPGAREIQRTRDELARNVPTSVILAPLHGSLDVDAQERALAPSGARKVILATNIAETSLTVEGVTTVIDSGQHRVLRYDTASGIDRLETERIGRDSAEQRTGRAGRTGPGRAIRLWDEREILRPHREPDVRRVDLASAVLDVVAWGEDPRRFEWFERPPDARMEAALALLRQLGAITNDERPRLTPVGEQLRALPLHPRLGRMILAARGAIGAIAIAATISEDSRVTVRETEPPTRRSDAFALLDAARAPSLRHTIRELSSIAQRVLGEQFHAEADEETLLRAILAGYPDRVAIRREPGSPRLLLATGTGAILGRESGVREGEFLVALDLGGSSRGVAGEAVVRMASAVDREWLAPTRDEGAHELLADGRVRAIRRLWYYALPLREQQGPPDPGEAARLLAAELRARIEAPVSEAAPLDDDTAALLRRLQFAQLAVDWDSVLAAATAGKNRLTDIDILPFLPHAIARRLDQLAPTTL
ncbi:MAG TPA: helicase-related protein, partial [Thermoanaerobaculia bacterium]|nr:helicase-related protein [Thermoanaerobaculia bacterium]